MLVVAGAFTLAMCLLLAPRSTFAVAIGSHTVDFIAVRYDFPSPGQSTWYYKVISGHSPSISHVTFELNLDCVSVLDAGTWGPSQDDLHSGGGDPDVGYEPTTALTGLKFDDDFYGGEKRKYYFTLDGNYPTGLITVAIKAGSEKQTGLVSGPSPVCDQPPPCLSSSGTCDDGNPCTDDHCDPEGGCTNTPNTDACDDGQFCTTGDTCSQGECSGTPALPPSCGDDNACTDNACDPQANDGAGGCVITNNTAPCDGGQFCTTGDHCSGGQCVTGGSVNCEDGNLCTIDVCNEQDDRCINTGDPSKQGQSCDDMSVCTANDVCDASGGCSGTPIVCNDGDDVCTADSCDPVSGCVFDVVVESPQCVSCEDGIDNENDGDTDLEDCDCNLLCGTFNYAVVAQRDSRRRTTYFGQGTRAKRGLDPVAGTANSPHPYPLGPSVASVCSQGQLELVSQSVIDGVATASTRAHFGHGEEMFLGFFTSFVPPGQIRTTGPVPFVGPLAMCSISLAPCVDDAQCGPREKCRPAMTLNDPGNIHVDISGAHPEFIACEDAKASLDPDFAALFALPPTQELGNLRFDHGDPPIIVTGPGPHVIRIGSLRVKTGVVMPIIGDPTTEAVIFQIERALTIGVVARVELQGGLTPDRVLWLADRRGRAYIGHTEPIPSDDDLATFPGTLLAPLKQIIVGKQARVAGALLGRQVQINEKAVVSHRPFIAAQP